MHFYNILTVGQFSRKLSHTYIYIIIIVIIIKIITVLEATESRKHQANDDKCSALGWVSTPLVVDSYGAWGKEASTFFELVAARLAIHKSLLKSQASFELFSNLSICLIRANARAILRRV